MGCEGEHSSPHWHVREVVVSCLVHQTCPDQAAAALTSVSVTGVNNTGLRPSCSARQEPSLRQSFADLRARHYQPVTPQLPD